MPKSMVSKVRARSPFVGFQIPQKPLDEAGLRWAEVDHLIIYIHLHSFTILFERILKGTVSG